MNSYPSNNKANKILPEEQYPLSQTREINRLINDKESKDNEYTSLINQADNEYESNNWEKALTHFKLAKAIYDKEYPNKRIEDFFKKPKLKSKKMKNLPPMVDVTDFVNHIDYLVKKIGINHVGISSDFDGGGGIVGWNDASETMNITDALRERGYSDSEIEKLWGGNLLRVLDKVQAVAAKLQSEEL